MPGGVPAFVKSYVHNIKGKGYIYRIKTPSGLYYKFVSDRVPSMIGYINPEDENFVEGFPEKGTPERDMLDTAPLLEDNTTETQMLINATQKRILNSEASERYSSLTRKLGGPNNGNSALPGFPGLTYKPGPFFKVKNSNLRKRAKQFGNEGARSLFTKPKRWSLFRGGKKSRKTRRAAIKKRQTRKRK